MSGGGRKTQRSTTTSRRITNPAAAAAEGENVNNMSLSPPPRPSATLHNNSCFVAAAATAGASRVGAHAVPGIDVDNVAMFSDDSTIIIGDGDADVGSTSNDAATMTTTTIVAEAVTNDDMANEIREQLRSEIRQELQAQLQQSQQIVTAEIVVAPTTTATMTETTITNSNNNAMVSSSSSNNDNRISLPPTGRRRRQGDDTVKQKRQHRRRLMLIVIPFVLLLLAGGAAVGALVATGVLGNHHVNDDNNDDDNNNAQQEDNTLVGSGGDGSTPTTTVPSPPSSRPNLRPTTNTDAANDSDATLTTTTESPPPPPPSTTTTATSNEMVVSLVSEQSIFGIDEGDQFGDFVVLSRDGSTMAVGATDGNYVQVFRRRTTTSTSSANTTVWTQIGPTVVGDGDRGDQFGRCLDLNENGSTLIVGAWNNDDASEKAGHAKVYRYYDDDDRWTQMGQTLTGDTSMDRFGWYVTMSDDGTTIAVSARLGNDPSDSNVIDVGYVRVFVYGNDATNDDDNSWIQLGPDLLGDATEDQFGRSLALDGAGQRLAVGAVHGGGGVGRVTVLDWQSSSNSWQVVGDALDGSNEEDWQGTSVALSQDGSMVAIGADGTDVFGSNSGLVRVYRYEGTDEAWIQHGTDILGESSDDQFGAGHISLSNDGRCLAVGANHNDNDRGRGYLYQWNDDDDYTDDWIMVAQVSGDSAGDRFGDSATVSGNCQWVAWGAFQSFGPGGGPSSASHISNTGSVHVYQIA